MEPRHTRPRARVALHRGRLSLCVHTARHLPGSLDGDSFNSRRRLPGRQRHGRADGFGRSCACRRTMEGEPHGGPAARAQAVWRRAGCDARLGLGRATAHLPCPPARAGPPRLGGGWWGAVFPRLFLPAPLGHPVAVARRLRRNQRSRQRRAAAAVCARPASGASPAGRSTTARRGGRLPPRAAHATRLPRASRRAALSGRRCSAPPPVDAALHRPGRGGRLHGQGLPLRLPAPRCLPRRLGGRPPDPRRRLPRRDLPAGTGRFPAHDGPASPLPRRLHAAVGPHCALAGRPHARPAARPFALWSHAGRPDGGAGRRHAPPPPAHGQHLPAPLLRL
mmetsp:Transcript_6469/g.21627  ORF Transcript_6469/g.21627 Transcript_6469/m.21627 type:complete len:336 (+) Transcript_6469:371-1378(+)